MDQTVIGNPDHDLVILRLSLATAARGSDLPDTITVNMLEQLIEGYESAFKNDANDAEKSSLYPSSIRLMMKESSRRSWKRLACERLENTDPQIPLGKRFWPLSKNELKEIFKTFEVNALCRLATSIKHREDNALVKVLDAAYWVKGCSSLGRLRYAVLLDVGNNTSDGNDLCLIEVAQFD